VVKGERRLDLVPPTEENNQKRLHIVLAHDYIYAEEPKDLPKGEVAIRRPQGWVIVNTKNLKSLFSDEEIKSWNKEYYTKDKDGKDVTFTKLGEKLQAKAQAKVQKEESNAIRKTSTQLKRRGVEL
jgi:hypothetical protein